MSEGKYRPANGSEGEDFMARFCERCIHDAPARRGDYDNACQILSRTLIHDVDDASYPTEWTYDWEGAPCCTAFLPESERA